MVRFAHTLALLVAAAAAMLPAAARAQGSNLGSYGKHFVPGAIVGKVTAGGVPVAGARVKTTAGQSTTTNATGDYTLYVDAPGIYSVSVTSGSKGAGPVEVSVTMGATTTHNFGRLIVLRPSRALPAKPHGSAGV